MADDDYSSQGTNRNWIYVALFFIALVLLVIFAGGLYVNSNRNARQEEARKIAEAKRNAPSSPTPTPLKDITDPSVRFALVRSYAVALNPLLKTPRQKDLETIISYIKSDPKILVTKNANLPQETALAVTNLKTTVKNLKVNGTMIKQDNSNASYVLGDAFNLTGIINFIAEDEQLGGSVFTLSDSQSGDDYYLHFNDLNSTSIKANMIGDEVILGVKVTSKNGEPLTFQITKGPTLTSSITYKPTKAPSATASATL